MTLGQVHVRRSSLCEYDKLVQNIGVSFLGRYTLMHQWLDAIQNANAMGRSR